MTESPLPSVEDDFVDPFDRLALKGQSVRPVLPPAYRTPDLALVQLADEFGLTTAGALDLCDELGIAAEHGGSSITNGDADRFRSAAAAAVAAAVGAVDHDEPELSLRARLNGLRYDERVARK
ncbi:MAG: hypothetical protein HYX32_03205 [Actinobacteria bacterium]|nr:hypothetical protein [Actinomycetota bacterium]